MKLRYMIEYALHDRIRAPRYDPIGVWVQGPGPGLELVIEFLPGHAEAGRTPSGSSTVWSRTTSGRCPRISSPTTSRRSRPTAACAEEWLRPTNIRRPRPAPSPF